jgi:hypothetical protein
MTERGAAFDVRIFPETASGTNGKERRPDASGGLLDALSV